MKTALVTGISRGIGKSICETLVQEGYFVHGTYRSGKASAETLKQQLKWVEIYHLDAGNLDSLNSFITQMQAFQFDAIVNNAAILNYMPLDQFDFKAWEEHLAVNLTAPLRICLGLKENIKAGGSIVNISSVEAFIGSINTVPYGASKAALNNLTKSLAIGLGRRGIRVNAIAPSWTETEMGTQFKEQVISLTPLGRHGQPQDVANAVSLLLSEKASFITGAILVVDGGLSCVDYILKLDADSMGMGWK